MLKKMLKEMVIGGLLMSMLVSALLGCASKNKGTAETIETLLQEKYGASFTVSALGNRYNNDSTTAYVYPDAESDLYFAVRLTDDGVLEYDGYPNRTVGRALENQISTAWSQHGIDVTCFATIKPYEPNGQINLTPAEFLETYQGTQINLALLVRSNDNLTPEVVEQVFGELAALFPQVSWGIGLYFVNEEDYTAVSDDIFHDTQTFGTSRIRSMGAEGDIGEVILQITDGQLVQSTTEIQEALQKGVV